MPPLRNACSSPSPFAAFTVCRLNRGEALYQLIDRSVTSWWPDKRVQPTDRCGVVIAMSEYTFDPPLMLIGNIVVRNRDDAVRFMIGYRKARRPALQTSVLYRLEGAAGETEERDAGKAFLGWAEAEHLIVKLGE